MSIHIFPIFNNRFPFFRNKIKGALHTYIPRKNSGRNDIDCTLCLNELLKLLSL